MDELPEPEGRDFIVPFEATGARLDQTLACMLPDHSRARLQAWIAAGRVALDGHVVTRANQRVRGGEQVIVKVEPDPDATPDCPEAIPLSIVHEDDTLLVVDKPAGLVVHPGSGNHRGTLLNALLHHVPRASELPRAGIVHRLDKDTSGLMVVAKTLEAQTDLVRQLQARTVGREYLALVFGESPATGTVSAPIARDPMVRTRMAIHSGGKPAITHFHTLERAHGLSLVRCKLETGRTHQIRVHMQHIGHPLVGDPVYRSGRPRSGPEFARQALHAEQLTLLHPVDGHPMSWHAPLPSDFDALLSILGISPPQPRTAIGYAPSHTRPDGNQAA